MEENHQDKTESKSLVAEDIKWVFNNRCRLWVPRYQRRRWKNFKNKFPFEWLNLLGVLAIPFVVTFMGLYFTQQVTQQQTQLSERQHRVDLQIAQDQQRAAILQTYIDNIQDLLLNHNLLKSTSGDDVATLARARTLTALRGLDPQRKGILLNFLYEAKLIGYYDHNTSKLLSSIIDLNGADLNGADLNGADLTSAVLTHTYLTNADLTNADLTSADLTGADLTGAYLTHTYLFDADLAGATLTNATLTNATLIGALLILAHLTGAHLTGAHLNDADLAYTYLTNDDLSDADLTNADLTNADLSDAHLSHANLTDAHLSDAHLSHASLTDAFLIGADLTDTFLTGADLSDANLSGSTVTQQQLDDVSSCKDTILPPGLTCHRNQ